MPDTKSGARPPASYELYNTATEQVEALMVMSKREADTRNRLLRGHGEPQRWVPQRTAYSAAGEAMYGDE